MRRFTIAVVGWFILASGTLAQERPFYGLLHGQTRVSDGRGTPDEAYAAAKAAGLDFFAVTERNHAEADGKKDAKDGIILTPQLYTRLKQSAANHTSSTFVALYGQEFSTISSGNHLNLLNAPEHCTVENGDFKTLYEEWLPDHPETVVQFNHPGFTADQGKKTKDNVPHNDYGFDDYDRDFAALAEAAAPHVALIEMMIGPAFNRSVSSENVSFSAARSRRIATDRRSSLNVPIRLSPSSECRIVRRMLVLPSVSFRLRSEDASHLHAGKRRYSSATAIRGVPPRETRALRGF